MQKRSKRARREGIHDVLEAHRRFDFDYIPFGDNWSVPDENYDYRGGKLHKIGAAAIRTILAAAGPLLLRIAYGARVEGKENLKPLKGRGAICVTNHFSFLDTLFVRAAVGHYRSYHTVAPGNNKRGIVGAVLRAGGVLPFSPNLAALRNLNAEMQRLLEAGKIINFYAEQAMWINYSKPRPMKDGAFHYAVRYGVPVLPLFCTFDLSRRGHIRKLRIHILPAVYPEEGPRRQVMERMRLAAERAWQDCYERVYSRPLVYLPAVRGEKSAKE